MLQNGGFGVCEDDVCDEEVRSEGETEQGMLTDFAFVRELRVLQSPSATESP